MWIKMTCVPCDQIGNGAYMLIICLLFRKLQTQMCTFNIPCCYYSDYLFRCWFMCILFRMILSVKGEAAKSEDMFAQIEEIMISVRLAFLNCFLDFAGMTFHHNTLIISTCKCHYILMGRHMDSHTIQLFSWCANLFSTCISSPGANWCWSFTKHLNWRELEKRIFWWSPGSIISQHLRKCCRSSQAVVDGLK